MVGGVPFMEWLFVLTEDTRRVNGVVSNNTNFVGTSPRQSGVPHPLLHAFGAVAAPSLERPDPVLWRAFPPGCQKDRNLVSSNPFLVGQMSLPRQR